MANLTPEQLARLQQMMQQGGQAEYYDAASGRSFMPTFGAGRYEGENYIPGEVTGFRGSEWSPEMYSDNFEMNGTQYDKFNAQGENTGQGTWQGLKKNSAMDTLLPIAMLAAPFAMSMFPSLGAAASFGTNPVTGAAGGGMGGAGLGTGSGAFVGEAPWTATGGGALDFGAGSAAGAGGGSGAFLGEGVASGIPSWDAAAKVAGGASKWLGPAATLLGAAAGGQGQKSSQTSERKTDPRVDPYLFGNNGQPGLLGMTYDQLTRDQSPERLAQRDQMRGVGMGLLSAPIAGNGFNKFFRG